jgi:hypothetical protein
MFSGYLWSGQISSSDGRCSLLVMRLEKGFGLSVSRYGE